VCQEGLQAQDFKFVGKVTVVHLIAAALDVVDAGVQPFQLGHDGFRYGEAEAVDLTHLGGDEQVSAHGLPDPELDGVAEAVDHDDQRGKKGHRRDQGPHGYGGARAAVAQVAAGQVGGYAGEAPQQRSQNPAEPLQHPGRQKREADEKQYDRQVSGQRDSGYTRQQRKGMQTRMQASAQTARRRTERCRRMPACEISMASLGGTPMASRAG